MFETPKKLMVKDLMVDLEKGDRVWEVINKPEEKIPNVDMRWLSSLGNSTFSGLAYYQQIHQWNSALSASSLATSLTGIGV